MDQMDAPPHTAVLAGYQPVRRIGEGTRSEVFLGRAPEAAGPGQTVALKLFRAGADGAAIDREVRCLLTVPPMVLTRLLDVATAPDSRVCLVEERLESLSLDRLLAERGRIGAGEAVTVLATMVKSLQLVHDAGYSHSGISASRVRFDARGRPVLLGLGQLDDLPPGAPGAARRRDDVVRLAGFVRGVLDHVEPDAPEAGTAPALLSAFEATATQRPFPRDLGGLESAVFAWAPASAVHGVRAGQRHMAGVPESAVRKVEPIPARSLRPDTVPPRTTRSSALAATGPTARTASTATTNPVLPVVNPSRPGGMRHWRVRQPESWTRLVRGPRGTVARISRASAAGAVRAVFRRVGRGPAVTGVLVAGVLVAGAVLGLAWLDHREEAVGAGTSALVDGSVTPDSIGPDHPDLALSAAISADDPAEAAVALLELRERCLAAASVLCLDGVDQPGSVAMTADVDGVRRDSSGSGDYRTGSDPSAFELTASVQERSGDAAMVVLTEVGAGTTQPAAALMIKGEAGWRLRELFDY